MKWLWVLGLGCVRRGVSGGNSAPGIGYFEARVQALSREARASGSMVDIRVSKALGARGYEYARVSVISRDAPIGRPAGFEAWYNDSFKYRWLAAYDLGRNGTGCESPYHTRVVEDDADCLRACSRETRCRYYSYDAGLCELSETCRTTEAPTTTYEKLGRNYLNTGLVSLRGGSATILDNVTLSLPRLGEGVRGIVISDPCYSSRWISCEFGDEWDAYNRTVLFLNAIGREPDVDFVAILGDNFYDQDGRLTTAVWDALSLDLKRKFLIVANGNHDTWVSGSPPGDVYDSYAWGLAQFYGQDAYASLSSLEPLDYSEGPDERRDWSGLNNNASNLFTYHILGDLGFIVYSGGPRSETVQDPRDAAMFADACAYVGAHVDALTAVFLLGHWNDASSGCSRDADVPHVRDMIATLDGCSQLGDKLKYMDGHTHCNQMQAAGVSEEVGFLIGGHGMSDCSQYGFALIDTETTPGALSVKYFEERNETVDNFDAVYACLTTSGVAACADTALATTWL